MGNCRMPAELLPKREETKTEALRGESAHRREQNETRDALIWRLRIVEGESLETVMRRARLSSENGVRNALKREEKRRKAAGLPVPPRRKTIATPQPASREAEVLMPDFDEPGMGVHVADSFGGYLSAPGGHRAAPLRCRSLNLSPDEL